jgi:UDP-N-acetylmuramoyl-tripeptide--D-alanyl-D-alanine ligase
MDIIFPYVLHLHILQLEGYQPNRFVKWIFSNFFVRRVESKKALVWTKKAKIIFLLSLFYSVLFMFFIVKKLGFLGMLVAVLASSQAYIFVLLGLLTLKPYEVINKIRVKRKTLLKIKRLKANGLRVIGITGSYGKTSVKEILYEMLRTKYKVLKTPESYNTVFGIYKVVRFELDEKYDFFICEMGAYKIGEIKELCDMVLPDHAILTGINEQHIERFGCIKNTVRAKFELVDSVVAKRNDNSVVLLNRDSKNVTDNYKSHVSSPHFYSAASSEYKLSPEGMDFESVICGKKVNFRTKILGYPYVSNITAAASFACILGIEIDELKKVVSRLDPVQHRLELKKYEDYTIIDDAYNSNKEGFKEAVNLLSMFNGKKKIFVTPGIIELGQQTKEIHEELGELLNKNVDLVILVGNNERTRSLSSKIEQEKKTFINSISEMHEAVKKTGFIDPIVLIENDLPENY